MQSESSGPIVLIRVGLFTRLHRRQTRARYAGSRTNMDSSPPRICSTAAGNLTAGQTALQCQARMMVGESHPTLSRDQLEKEAAEGKVRPQPMLLSGQPCGPHSHPRKQPQDPQQRPGVSSKNTRQHSPVRLPAAGVARGGGGGLVSLPLDAFGDSQ